MTNLLPGDFGVVATKGRHRFDRWIGALIRWDTNSPVNHAVVYIGNGKIVEATPSGAKINDVTEYNNIIWSSGKIPLTDYQRQTIVNASLASVGIGYNFLDILAIAFAQTRWHNKPFTGAIARRISNSGTLICSQLVDRNYWIAGVHLFEDGRLFGQVSPGDLYTYLLNHPGN